LTEELQSADSFSLQSELCCNWTSKSYALESLRISECSGIREPKQGKRDSTQAKPLQTFSSLASIGSGGLKNTFLLHKALLIAEPWKMFPQFCNFPFGICNSLPCACVSQWL
jgi:hypothetical protein